MNNRGKRYDEPKLNMKKVFAVGIAFIVIVMCIVTVNGLLDNDNTKDSASKNYFSVYKDEKWGVIDETGEFIITPSYAEMIVIPNKERAVFLCTYDVNYETGEYKTKAINDKGEDIFTTYDQIMGITNQYENSQIWYEENILKVQDDGKIGLIDITGRELVQPQYDEIKTIQGIDDILIFKTGDKYGVIDFSGKEILSAKYLEIGILGKTSNSGFIVKDENGKYGVVNYSGNIVLESKYDKISNVSGNDMYVVYENNVEKLIKNDGTTVLDSGYNEIVEIPKEPNNVIIYKENDLYGIMDITGTVLIAPEYQYLSELKSGIFLAKQNELYGAIDISKSIKIEFKYNNIVYNEKADIYISEDSSYNNEIIDNNFIVRLSGYLIELNEEKEFIELNQNNEYKYYNFKLEEKHASEFYPEKTLFVSKENEKYGFVDKNGKTVIDKEYDDVTEQNEYGYAGIKLNGKWGVINSEGKIVQEPIYDLEQYIKLDFIDKWHYGIDLNMNYYTQ